MLDDLRYFIESTAGVADRLASDSRGFGSSKIGPKRLAAAAAQVVGVMVRQDQEPSAKPVLRKDTELPLVEVRAQRLAGQRRRQDHLLGPRPEEKHDERHGQSRSLQYRHEQGSQPPRPQQASVERQGARGRKPCSTISETRV